MSRHVPIATSSARSSPKFTTGSLADSTVRHEKRTTSTGVDARLVDARHLPTVIAAPMSACREGPVAALILDRHDRHVEVHCCCPDQVRIETKDPSKSVRPTANDARTRMTLANGAPADDRADDGPPRGDGGSGPGCRSGASHFRGSRTRCASAFLEREGMRLRCGSSVGDDNGEPSVRERASVRVDRRAPKPIGHAALFRRSGPDAAEAKTRWIPRVPCWAAAARISGVDVTRSAHVDDDGLARRQVEALAVVEDDKVFSPCASSDDSTAQFARPRTSAAEQIAFPANVTATFPETVPRLPYR